MFITGLTPSVVRAGIMHILMLLGGVIYRKNDTWNTLAISLLIILIYNPFLINSLSVLLSYGGTIGILTLNKTVLYLLKKIRVKNKKYKYKIKKKFAKPIKFIRESLSITISVQIVILPIVIKSFHLFGLSFLITNIFLSIIIIPIICIGLIIIIVSLTSIFILKSISFFYIPFIKLLIFISELGKILPLNKIYIIAPGIFQIIIYYSVVFLQNFIIKIYKSKAPSEFEYRIRNIISLIKYKIKQNKNKVISGALIISTFISILYAIPQNLKIYFIDVGQGDSTLIVTPKKQSILIDGGGNDNYDVGTNTLLPYLLSRKITKIDYIIISHFDQDHIGGILTVMENLRVGQVIISKQAEDSENFRKFKNIVNERKIKINVLNKGSKVKIEKDIYFDILWPCSENLISEGGLNNNSIVCNLHYREFSMLFTGDIEEKAEKKILKEYENNKKMLSSTILKIAHHGSKTSSIEQFLKAVNPKIALIGVGKNNVFGHPNADVLTRLESIRN